MKLSIVATMYNSSKYIEEFLQRVSACAEKITSEFEIFLVDDGSPDDSLKVALAARERFPQLSVIELAKNHGHHRAMMIGLSHAAGEYTFLTDIDLEEEPENLTAFWQAMSAEPDLDVVFGEQEEKTTSGAKRFASSLFYQLFNALSETKISDRELVSRLMTRRFVDTLIQYQEESIFLPAMWTHAGFRQKAVTASKAFDGHSTYTFRRKLMMVVDAVTSFSVSPLVIVFYSGMGISVAAGVSIVYFVWQKLVMGTPLLGWTSLIASIFFMGGLILSSLGVIGIYISKIYLEVKSRPRSVVRAIHHGPNIHD